ncbi:MAG: hypothetical protein OXL37_00990 [Chloroflexota bacterium]|nr:hypothetical protein [Chloroflexota bacterium]MDE2961176.1 hypothetical protein [Chloroflexota bacterium]
MAHFRIVVWLSEDREAGVGMQIYKPGANDVARRVNHATRVFTQIRVIAPVDRHRVARYRYRRAEPGAARAVDYLSIGNQ